jgi:cellulose synthase/poly-beta-1,6-N-acetylglucosamine synthase-like glycosyltransferase
VTAGELRVLALLATYNEERFIEGCLEHLVRNGVEIYLMDNDSTDDTLGIAERYLGRSATSSTRTGSSTSTPMSAISRQPGARRSAPRCERSTA